MALHTLYPSNKVDMTHAVQALARTTMNRKNDPTWIIIMLTEDHKIAKRYTTQHQMNGGQQLRMVDVSMSKEAQENCCPYAVEIAINDRNPVLFRYEPEALAFASHYLNSIVSTHRRE